MLNTTDKALVRKILPTMVRVNREGKKISIGRHEFLIDTPLGSDGILVKNDNEYTIALGGSNELLDFVVNCAKDANDLGVHTGFYRAFEVVWSILFKQIYTDIEATAPEIKTYLKKDISNHASLIFNCIGFSKGSAVNNILACKLANCGFNQNIEKNSPSVYTVGMNFRPIKNPRSDIIF